MNCDREPFSRLVAALEPWLDRLVFIGGRAHQLYRLHPHAQPLDYPPLSTLDSDVAVPENLLASQPDLRGRLLAHGFAEEFLGGNKPPATHYRLGNDESGFYAEFLTPFVGSEYDRKGKRKATAAIAGVNAQRLRHIELLLLHPWLIDFKCRVVEATIRIANPVSFLAQKVLIHRGRLREDRAKDLLYMRDTLEVFSPRLVELHDLWQACVAPQASTRAARTISKASDVLFGSITDDLRRAAEISAERALSPEAIRETCHYGFTRVFG